MTLSNVFSYFLGIHNHGFLAFVVSLDWIRIDPVMVNTGQCAQNQRGLLGQIDFVVIVRCRYSDYRPNPLVKYYKTRDEKMFGLECASFDMRFLPRIFILFTLAKRNVY
jgi:hypothetical protein